MTWRVRASRVLRGCDARRSTRGELVRTVTPCSSTRRPLPRKILVLCCKLVESGPLVAVKLHRIARQRFARRRTKPRLETIRLLLVLYGEEESSEVLLTLSL